MHVAALFLWRIGALAGRSVGAFSGATEKNLRYRQNLFTSLHYRICCIGLRPSARHRSIIRLWIALMLMGKRIAGVLALFPDFRLAHRLGDGLICPLGFASQLLRRVESVDLIPFSSCGTSPTRQRIRSGG